MNVTDREIRAAIERGKSVAQEWNACDPQTSIPAEAAKQIVLAALNSVDVSDLVITSALQKLDDPMQAHNVVLRNVQSPTRDEVRDGASG
jgi:hypothetical protein